MTLSSLFIYISVVSVLLLLIMGIDKYKAIHGQFRIRERTIWIYAAMGGALGGWLGMYLFRHKTKHTLFVLGLPALTIIQFIGVLFLINQLQLS
ncbi:DUF1294 domain-containing protein [Lentibacillus saliphilus]|uniref:DUF1294 domain-containing protein n=1 Tax=Lentibacillus saliphilus TaxID=2737028 RepID=UPI001C2F4FF9|nr:DUF1294 domain-containing protein [Lentibacillus saliphilus]